MKPMKWMMGILLSMTMFTGVHAEETGSLTLQCHINEDEVLYFVGDTYAVLPVADLILDEGDAGYVMRDEFVSFDCDWDELTASQLNDYALEMAEKADFSSSKQGVTDETGEVVFYDLKPAMYLVKRIETAEGNEKYSADPMLISVPSFSDNAWTYDVVTTPKFSEVTIREEPEEPEETDDKLPETGQLKWPVPVLVTIGAGLVGSGVILNRRKNTKEQ